MYIYEMNYLRRGGEFNLNERMKPILDSANITLLKIWQRENNLYVILKR